MFRNPLTDGIVILLILLLFFGPKRLPMLSRSIGESIKEFRGGFGGNDDDDKKQLDPAPSDTKHEAAGANTESTASEQRDSVAK